MTSITMKHEFWKLIFFAIELVTASLQLSKIRCIYFQIDYVRQILMNDHKICKIENISRHA